MNGLEKSGLSMLIIGVLFAIILNTQPGMTYSEWGRSSIISIIVCIVGIIIFIN